MDWSCTAWSACENSWETRLCEFAKVPQHTQKEECPSAEKRPEIARKCQTIQKSEAQLNESQQQKNKARKETKKNETALPAGAAVADLEGRTSKLFLGATVIALIVVGALSYLFAFGKPETRERIKKAFRRKHSGDGTNTTISIKRK
jgi:hypothetical protein